MMYVIYKKLTSMLAENFGRHLSCWKEGGRKACKKDPIFNEMEADMNNLVSRNW